METYATCRASGPLTQLRAAQPFTVFTLALSDKFREDGKTVSIARIFNEIAKEVLKNKADGCLDRSLVEHAMANYDVKVEKVDVEPRVASNNKNKDALCNILGQYQDNSTKLVIISNKELNDQLEILANNLSSSITDVNSYSEAFLRYHLDI